MNLESISAYTEEQLTLELGGVDNLWTLSGFQTEKDLVGVTTTGSHECSGIQLSSSNSQVGITFQLPDRENVSSLMFETSADSNILSFDQVKIDDKDTITTCST